MTARPNTPSKPLRLNFYEQPDQCLEIIASMLAQDNKTSNYIRSFGNVKLPSIESIAGLPEGDKTRPIRKVQMYWAILKKAGFDADERRLRAIGLISRNAKHFSPHFNNNLRTAAYGAIRNGAPPVHPDSLSALVSEFDVMAEFRRTSPNDPALQSGSGSMFDPDDIAMLEFLNPATGSG